MAPEITLARIGGDEFGMLAEGIDDAALDAIAVAVLGEVRRPARLGRRQVASSCSLGAAWITDRHRTAEEVLQAADIAMYEAKRAGSGQFRMFATPMLAGITEAIDLRAGLRDAIAQGEFELHYQPVWSVGAKTLTGFEALVRWRNPRLGLLQPDAFIPAAEEAGQVRDIGRWVLQEGCRQLDRWTNDYPGLALTLHVNVCGEELKDPAYVQELEAMLLASAIGPGRLELEITEGIFLEHSDAVLRTLAAVRALGVRIAIDDLGTGYSSLSYLDRHEIDTVKIDRSFVSRISTEVRTKVVVEAVVRLGRALALHVIAEGVETEQKLEILAALGCESVQGFLTGRPAAAPAWSKVLADVSDAARQSSP